MSPGSSGREMRPVGNEAFSGAIPQLDHLDWLIEAFRNTESSHNRYYELPEIKSNLYTLVRVLLVWDDVWMSANFPACQFSLKTAVCCADALKNSLSIEIEVSNSVCKSCQKDHIFMSWAECTVHELHHQVVIMSGKHVIFFKSVPLRKHVKHAASALTVNLLKLYKKYIMYNVY